MTQATLILERFDCEIDAFLAKSPRPVLHGAVINDKQTVEFSRGCNGNVSSPVFEIGSVGKTFTTTLLALMVRERQVALDDPVARFRPQYAFARHVTLGDLACHASGLPLNPVRAWSLVIRAQKFTAGYTPDDLEAFLVQQPERLRRLGKFGYSNAGMALLGHILGDCLGMSYEQAVRERILQPLDMSETRIDPASWPANRLLPGHDPGGNIVPPFAWAGLEPAGLWRSTVADMTRFLQAQMGQHGAEWRALAELTTQPRLKAKKDLEVGLGWLLSPMDGGGVYAWHSGGTFGQTSMVAWSSESGRAVVLLTNRRPPLWHFLSASRRLEDLAEGLVQAPAD